MKKWEQLQLTLTDSKSEEGQRNYWDKTQICSRQRDFELSNGILLRRPVRYFDFWNVLNEGLHGVQFFEYANYWESTVFMNFQFFFLKFIQHPPKIVEEMIFVPLSLHQLQ